MVNTATDRPDHRSAVPQGTAVFLNRLKSDQNCDNPLRGAADGHVDLPSRAQSRDPSFVRDRPGLAVHGPGELAAWTDGDRVRTRALGNRHDRRIGLE